MNIILFKEGENIIKRGDERFSHIKKVLHLSLGDSFKAGIINARQGYATIDAMNDDEIVLSFDLNEERTPLYPLTLIVAQVRPICMKRILREAVTLGASRLLLAVSDLGEKSYLNASLYQSGEYEEILLDGAMQSGFSSIPETLIMKSLDEAIAKDDSEEKILLDNVIGAEPLSHMDLRGKSVTLAIGPERGWSDRERRMLLSSGYKPALLGSRILRTETAVSAGSAVALSRMGIL